MAEHHRAVGVRSIVVTTVWMLLVSCVTAAENSTTPIKNYTICTTNNNNTFTVKVNLFTGQLGYFSFEECGEDVIPHPTIGLIVGETYTFVQKDVSNWMHPMGFAYYPDGAHDDKMELEPSVTPYASVCNATNECPSPRYYIDDTYQGENGTANFGLDVYEPLFARSIAEWSSLGTFSFQLNFNDSMFTDDIFYFCHIHQYMSGRIKLLSENGTQLNADRDFPTINEDEYYNVLGEFDSKCGTYGLDDYQLPNDQCPSHFVCHDDTTTTSSMPDTTAQGDVTNATYTNRGGNEVNEQYADCLDAMNCHMLAGITNGYNTSTMTEASVFIYQMIPHHENAINMAKNLLRLKGTDNTILTCTDYTDEEDQQCIMETMLREIINAQNHEIQLFSQYLEKKGFAKDAEQCKVEIKTITSNTTSDNTTNNNDTAPAPSPTSSTATPPSSPGTRSAADTASSQPTILKKLFAVWIISTVTYVYG